MKKICYWLGVYVLCNIIQGFLTDVLPNLIKKINQEKRRTKNDDKKEEQPRSGISARSDMVMNRIGF